MTGDSGFGPVRSTGLSGAARVPAGATIDRVYFGRPGPSGVGGGAFDTYREALVEAIAWKTAQVARHVEVHKRGAGGAAFVPLPERFAVDCRWKMSWPVTPGSTSSGLDTVAERTEYDSIAEAQAHLDRIDRYSPTSPAGPAGRGRRDPRATKSGQRLAEVLGR